MLTICCHVNIRPQIGVTAALINSNLRLGSLVHCITVGRCKVVFVLLYFCTSVFLYFCTSVFPLHHFWMLQGKLYADDWEEFSRYRFDTVWKIWTWLQGIIFDYSLGEAVGDIVEDLLRFDPNFTFFHVNWTMTIATITVTTRLEGQTHYPHPTYLWPTVKVLTWQLQKVLTPQFQGLVEYHHEYRGYRGQ